MGGFRHAEFPLLAGLSESFPEVLFYRAQSKEKLWKKRSRTSGAFESYGNTFQTVLNFIEIPENLPRLCAVARTYVTPSFQDV